MSLVHGAMGWSVPFLVKCICSFKRSLNLFCQLPLIITACFYVDLINVVYQSPLILTELFQNDLINISYLTACYLYQVMMTLHFLNDVANDAESTQKSKFTS